MGSGDLPGLQNRCSVGSSGRGCVRLAHASAIHISPLNYFAIRQYSPTALAFPPSGSSFVKYRSTSWQSYTPWFFGSFTIQYSPAFGATHCGNPSLQFSSRLCLPSLIVTITTPLDFSVPFTVIFVFSCANACIANTIIRKTMVLFIARILPRRTAPGFRLIIPRYESLVCDVRRIALPIASSAAFPVAGGYNLLSTL